MVKFKCKISGSRNQHIITIPAFFFNQNLIDFDPESEYQVEITKIEKQKDNKFKYIPLENQLPPPQDRQK